MEQFYMKKQEQINFKASSGWAYKMKKNVIQFFKHFVGEEL